MERIILKADKGMVLTDGKVFGRTIYLADGRNKEEFYALTEEEFKEMISVSYKKYLLKNIRSPYQFHVL